MYEITIQFIIVMYVCLFCFPSWTQAQTFHHMVWVNKCRDVLPDILYLAGYCCYAVFNKINSCKKIISERDNVVVSDEFSPLPTGLWQVKTGNRPVASVVETLCFPTLKNNLVSHPCSSGVSKVNTDSLPSPRGIPPGVPRIFWCEVDSVVAYASSLSTCYDQLSPEIDLSGKSGYPR